MNKMYLAHFDNGEAWEDHSEHISDTIHRTKQSCIDEIIADGYVYFKEVYANGVLMDGYKYTDPEYCSQISYARIIQLEILE